MPIFSFPRIIKMGAINFWRNIWLSMASTLVMVLTLISFSVLMILNLMGNAAVKNLKSQIDITAYLNNTLSSSRIAEIKSQIQAIPQVTDIKYISAEEALANFRQKHEGDRSMAEILKEFESNPLEPILVIKAADPADYPTIVSELEQTRYQEAIRKVNYKDNQEMISRITAAANSFIKGGLAVSIIFMVIAIMVMFNTIRVTIYSRQKEIEIMKIVGATNWYIRWPMIIEGILYGLVASLISLAILYPATRALSPSFQKYFQDYGIDLAQYFNQYLLQIVGIQIMVAVLLGVISSTIAIGKYLHR